MAGKAYDLTGKRFERLVVIKRVENDGIKVRWLCRCDCGNEVVAKALSLNAKYKKSCGCVRFNQKNLSSTRLYRIWFDMKRRCYNKGRDDYKFYGERGITICDEWRENFLSFYEWSLSNGYQEDLSIDRIDFNGNYNPSNCRWITMDEQKANRRNVIKFDLDGEIINVKELSGITKLTPSNIRARVRREESFEDVLKGKKLKVLRT